MVEFVEPLDEYITDRVKRLVAACENELFDNAEQDKTKSDDVDVIHELTWAEGEYLVKALVLYTNKNEMIYEARYDEKDDEIEVRAYEEIGCQLYGWKEIGNG